MTPMTIDQAMQVAFGHHQSGRLAEAEALYRQVLAAFPITAKRYTGSAYWQDSWVTPMRRSL